MSDDQPTELGAPPRRRTGGTGYFDRALKAITTSATSSDAAETARLELVLKPYTRIIWILAALNVIQFIALIGVVVAFAGGSVTFKGSANGVELGVSADEANAELEPETAPRP